MILNSKINANIKIERIEDLYKLKHIMKNSNLKVNKAALARELGCDPRTVAKYINGYIKCNNRNRISIVDEYRDIITELLNSDTQIFFYKRVLWQYLKDNHGLKCGQSTFRRYINNNLEFKEYFQSKSKRIIKKSLMRFETGKGEQAQLDWKEDMRIILKNGETISINIFVLILSFSRFRVYRLALSKSQDILLSFMDEALETFGGVPKEILTDNMKTVMDKPRTEYSKGKINNKFKQFADDYGFKVKPCIAGRPNTKAKVESPMKLLDELYAYNGLLNYEELNERIKILNERVNSSCHTNTRKIPILHLKKEKDFLSALPPKNIRNPYKIATQSALVNKQSLLSYKSNSYSVPPKYIGKYLKLQAYDNKLHLYYNTKLIAIHTISNKKINYRNNDYLEISKLSLNKNLDIEKITRKNLKMIGEVYSHNK